MADILVADRQHHAHRHSRSIGGLDSGMRRLTAPKIEMVANPAFSFPMQPLSSANDTNRPTSMLLPPSASLQPAAHKRAASALPSFSFNASDNSGRHDEQPPRTPDENAMAAAGAARKGHRRGGSEFVGGDSRFGVSNAISSSPTKTDMPQLPLPADTGSQAICQTHRHRRSVAVSSHDLSNIVSSGERSPRLSSSLPTTPLEMPYATFQRHSSTSQLTQRNDLEATRQDSRDESPVRPGSRPRVEFVEEVEIIPRPLSTISAETESSMSTVRGHSVNNSITSVLSLGSSSPASPRARGQPEPALASIAEPRTQRSSVELSKRLEREGEWLKSKATEAESIQSTSTTPASPPQPALSYDRIPPPSKRQKRQGLGQSLGFDRRRSEPAILASAAAAAAAAAAANTAHVSAESLHETKINEDARPTTSDAVHGRRSSGHRLKHWALSKLHLKPRENASSPQSNTTDSNLCLRSESAESVDVPGKISVASHPVAMTDLDAVFGSLDTTPLHKRAQTPSRITFDTPSGMYDQSAIDDDDDDDGAGPMLDLDAATEPLRTPPLLSSSHRRQLHSDRTSKQASTTSNFIHRRAESEPAMATFNYNRAAATSQKSMEDVFEEDEDDEHEGRPQRQHEEAGMGITIVDADDGVLAARRHSARDMTRPATSYVAPTPRLFVPSAAVDRPASIIDEVIVEESSPVEGAVDEIEIVQAHEEPRASSFEKHSDSSEASTLLGASLTLPAGSDVSGSMSPNTLHNSAFSSPDLLRRQGSFEASRVGTSASSLADTRTTSSCTTGEGIHDMRMSVDDVPSLTSSRSTMLSTMHANNSRRELSDAQDFIPRPRKLDPAQAAAKRKKRASIQSLSQLMGAPFGSKTKLADESRPRTASVAIQDGAKKKDNRLKKLMFWRSRQSLRQAALDDQAMGV